jgi:hypothetical protein
MAAPFGEQRYLGIVKKFKHADQAITATARPGAPRLLAQCITAHAQWIVALQHFDGGVERVGHMRLYSAQSTAMSAGTHAAADSLIVVPAPRTACTHRQIVHGAVTRGRYRLGQRLGQGATDHINHTCAGLHVACRHRRGALGVQQRATWCRQRNGTKRTGASRSLRRHQTTKHIIDSCGCHGERAVDVAWRLRGCPVEIHMDAALLYFNHCMDDQIPVSGTIIIETVLEHITAIGYDRERRLGQTLCVIIEFLNTTAPHLDTHTRHQRLQSLHAGTVGTDLCGKITV